MGSSTEHSAYGPDPQPVGPRPDPRRLRWRLRRGGRRLHGAAGDRHRHRRLDPAARRGHRHGRRQADLRRGLALRPGRDGQLARPGRPGDPDRARRGPAARDHRRARPARLHQHRPAASRCSRSRPAPAPPASSTALRVGVVTELGGEGYQPGVQQRFDEAVELLVKAGAEIVQVSCPHFVHALAAYYLVMPSEASSNLARFDAMRYGLRVLPEGVEAPERRGGHARHPRPGLRRRGEAPHHPRHLRPVQRLLRRLLRPGAEGAHADQPRLRARLRAGRRAGLADRADHRVQAGGEARRPAGDVPQRHRHHPGQPRRRPRDLGARRARARGRPAGRLPGARPGDGRRPRSTGSAPRWRPCSSSSGAARCIDPEKLDKAVAR